MGRSLWRDSGFFVCTCCWTSPEQPISGPSSLGLTTIYCCLRFETFFSSPPKTRRVTVEVFDPAATRGAKWIPIPVFFHILLARAMHGKTQFYCCVAQTTQKASHVISISSVHWLADCYLTTSYKHASYCWVNLREKMTRYKGDSNIKFGATDF
jgi:hypothetical protein